MTDLMKHCPYCGGKATIAVYGLSYTGICENCGAETAPRNTREEAIAAWNRRAYDTLHEAVRECAMRGYTRREAETAFPPIITEISRQGKGAKSSA